MNESRPFVSLVLSVLMLAGSAPAAVAPEPDLKVIGGYQEGLMRIDLGGHDEALSVAFVGEIDR
jgi:hypothetical protein